MRQPRALKRWLGDSTPRRYPDIAGQEAINVRVLIDESGRLCSLAHLD